MNLISEIEIEGFRSVREARLSDLGNFTAFAGLNNSGKSNLLRATHAFFTDYTDPEQLLSVDDDYYRPDLRKKKAKRIRVTVKFNLPSSFKFRKGLEPVSGFLGSSPFRITKEWRRLAPSASYFLNDVGPLGLEERHKVDQFLQLISFRYIPNRVLPVQVIQSEHRALRDVLVRRLGAKGEHEKAFGAIAEVSRNLIKALADRMKSVYPTADVRLATPVSWGDMAFAFGYLLRQGDVEIEDNLQGSGIQSLLMFETLYLIDRDYFQKFGWRQAAVWAIEEPEASLHSSLEAQVAAFLRRISTDPGSRLQILSTTHSDLILQYADRTFFVDSGTAGTNIQPSGAKEILDKSSRAGISRWVHPVLYFPLDPLVLVEGKYDRIFLEKAFQLLGSKKPIRIADLEEIEGKGSGGADRLVRYVRDNAEVIRNRRTDSPVVVLLDWDASSKEASVLKPFQNTDPITVSSWPSTSLNPRLGKSFRGIERCYSDRLIQEAAKNAGLQLATKGKAGTVVVESDEYGQLKTALNDLIKKGGLLVEDLQHAKGFLVGILTNLGAL